VVMQRIASSGKAAKISRATATALGRTGVVPQLRLTGRELVDERQGLRIGLRHVGGGEMIGGGI
jgi:hypothetical protein